ncbi:hypothetical protein [Demequina sp. NBRC 110054]|uniref:hypothetical protein n=1 Tax=Demequina sp. NBRC 110054 TaxID=1570343 RepID=UPI0009FD1E89|nr:hypothetical protein [Demequina sp. NBRC 110054]
MTSTQHGGTILHMGPLKTATSTIQQSLASSRELLGEHGLVYPGGVVDHNKIARYLTRPHVVPDAQPTAERFLAESAAASAAGKTVLVSCEYASTLDIELARALVEQLPQPVRVLMTWRNLPDLLISRWQQAVKSGLPNRAEDWLGKALKHPEKLDFRPIMEYSTADGHTMVSRWCEVAGADNVTAVILDPKDRGAVFRSFEQYLDLPDGSLAATGDRNLSMTQEDLDIVYRVGEGSSDLRTDRASGYRVQLLVREGFSRGLIRNPEPGTKPMLPAALVEPAREAGRAIGAALVEAGVTVMGSVDDLAREPRGVKAHDSEPATSVATSRAAAGLAETLARSYRKPFDGPSDESDGVVTGEPGAALEIEVLGPRSAALVGGLTGARPGQPRRGARLVDPEGHRRGLRGLGLGALIGTLGHSSLEGFDDARAARIRKKLGAVARMEIVAAPAATRLYRLWCAEVSGGSTESWEAFADRVVASGGAGLGDAAATVRRWGALVEPSGVVVKVAAAAEDDVPPLVALAAQHAIKAVEKDDVASARVASAAIALMGGAGAPTEDALPAPLSAAAAEACARWDSELLEAVDAVGARLDGDPAVLRGDLAGPTALGAEVALEPVVAMSRRIIEACLPDQGEPRVDDRPPSHE